MRHELDSREPGPPDLDDRAHPITTIGPPRVYRAAAGSSSLVSALRVVRVGLHDDVTVWNRGAYAGHIMLGRGDGAALAVALGLELHPDEVG